MRDTETFRSLPMVDRLMLIAVVACLGIAVVRFGLVVATVPYAVYTNQRAISAAKAAGAPVPTERITERVAHSWPFVSWWGGRDVPDRQGGDYFGIIAQHSTERTLGCVVGVIAEQQRKKGVAMTRVILPEDQAALYGDQAGTPMTRADGTVYRSYWGPPASDAVRFTDVPIVEQAYQPVLTAGQASAVRAGAGLVERSQSFYVGAPRAGGSGTWVLRVIVTGEKRDYVLVPLEASPIGGVL